ncbi:hypothetical protein FO519_001648 [Halicephalobus sp. NKZ332]|nr:hypothetical protein FO519_001648 [Halicephalobus sp. NKZ332]
MAGLNAFADFGAPPRGTSRTGLPPSGPSVGTKAQNMFQTLRRLHGQNLESQGLNDLSEAFQSFVTRAKFFSIGRLRRTWSHSAVEFMKYRRLLPMLVADEADPGSVFDDFDTSPMCFSARPAVTVRSTEDKRITVTNISPRITIAQLQSFFGKFGKVISVKNPSDERRKSSYGTLPKKHVAKFQMAHVSFAKEEAAQAALNAPTEELIFYGQQMNVQPYASLNRRKTVNVTGRGAAGEGDQGSSGNISAGEGAEGQLSRSSSIVSMSSSGTTSSSQMIFALDELPKRVLERVFVHLNIVDRIRLERVSKRFLEASMASWKASPELSFKDDPTLARRFNQNNPLRNVQLKSILMRSRVHLKKLDLSGVTNLLNDKAVEDIAHLCTELQELDLSGVHASADALRSLSGSLPALKKLSYRDMKSTGDKVFWFLFQSCGRNLNFVDVRGCSRFKGRCFKLFGMLLEQILLDGCQQIDNETIDDICLKSSHVHVLRLNGCYNITDDAISAISRHLCELKEFSLSGDRFIGLTTEGLFPVLRIDSITSLELDHSPLVDDMLLEKVVDGLRNLQKLSIAFAGSDATLTEKSLLKLKELSDLRELDLSGIAAVNSTVVKGIASSCSKLTTVYLRNCIYLGDEGIETLSSLRNLIHIDLSSCILVTAKPIQELVKAFKAEDGGESVTVVLGGTVCEPNQVRLRNTRIVLDFNDYSGTSLAAFRQLVGSKECSTEPENLSDEEDSFELLEAHRSFIVDALNAEDDFPEGQDEKSIRAWAEREAEALGLTILQSPSTERKQ